MQNLELVWTHPTQREDGTQLPPNQFHVNVGMRAQGDSGDFTKINQVEGDAAPRVDIPSVSGGTWEFLLQVEDKQGNLDNSPVILTHTVPFADPMPVTDASVNVLS